jgi:hypothetical protein
VVDAADDLEKNSPYMSGRRTPNVLVRLVIRLRAASFGT